MDAVITFESCDNKTTDVDFIPRDCYGDFEDSGSSTLFLVGLVLVLFFGLWGGIWCLAANAEENDCKAGTSNVYYTGGYGGGGC